MTMRIMSTVCYNLDIDTEFANGFVHRIMQLPCRVLPGPLLAPRCPRSNASFSGHSHVLVHCSTSRAIVICVSCICTMTGHHAPHHVMAIQERGDGQVKSHTEKASHLLCQPKCSKTQLYLSYWYSQLSKGV